MIYWLPAILILPYVAILLKIFRSLLKIVPFEITSIPTTFVSVVVACRNEQKRLPHLLRSISDQNYPEELFEVIIVDDNSTDNTYEIASGHEERGNIVVVKNTGRGKKYAIGTGISKAIGNLIITTDADCRMGRNWIRTIAAFYELNNPDMIICPVQVEPMSGFFGRFQELEFMSLQGITAGSVFQSQGTMCNGANLAFTKEAYLKNAGNLHFEIATGDDVFLLHSIKKQIGSKILWLESPHALVITSPAPNTCSYFRQRRRWISKSKAYTDSFSIILGIITFVAVVLQVSMLVAGIIDLAFLPGLLSVFLLKCIPDFFILRNTTSRYGRKKLMNWFLPAQIVYPFYVLGILLYSLILPQRQEH